jgi:sigma-B regulation protein RsbU (phosphoserine phosphatase)
MVGVWPDCSFESATAELDPFAQLYLYSDGVFEVTRPTGPMWQFDDFVQYVAAQPRSEAGFPDRLLAYVRDLHGGETLADDFSLLEVKF